MSSEYTPSEDDYIPTHERSTSVFGGSTQNPPAPTPTIGPAETMQRYGALVKHAAWMDVRVEELERAIDEMQDVLGSTLQAYEELEQLQEQVQRDLEEWRELALQRRDADGKNSEPSALQARLRRRRPKTTKPRHDPSWSQAIAESGLPSSSAIPKDVDLGTVVSSDDDTPTT